MPKLILETEKTVQQTLSDFNRLFKQMSIEEWMPVPDDTGPGYTVKFMYQRKWVPISSTLQPTKAGNLRMCYRAVHYVYEMQLRGITGAVSQIISEMGLVATEAGAASALAEDYAILGLDNDAGLTKIKEAYRSKVKKYHPDNAVTGDEDIFKSLDRAYKRLLASKGEKA